MKKNFRVLEIHWLQSIKTQCNMTINRANNNKLECWELVVHKMNWIKNWYVSAITLNQIWLLHCNECLSPAPHLAFLAAIHLISCLFVRTCANRSCVQDSLAPVYSPFTLIARNAFFLHSISGKFLYNW